MEKYVVKDVDFMEKSTKGEQVKQYNRRQEAIIRYLAEVKFVRTEHLAEMFQVSPETIRRDLLELEKDSSVKKVRGGAVHSCLRAQELEYEKRMESNQVEKHAIALAAVAYINNGDAIAMNNGSGTLELAKVLAKERETLTIITNSPDIAVVLNEGKGNQVYLTSGYLRKHNKSLVGSMCRECLGNFKVDKSILSIDGISIQDGVMEYHAEEADILRKMLEIGHTKVILCEYEKFSEVALNRVCSAEMVDYIFTDWNISMRERKEWEKIGVKVVAAAEISP